MQLLGFILIVLFFIIAFIFLGSAIVLSNIITREEYDNYVREEENQQK